MKDFNQQEIHIGDDVIFYKVGYKRLMRGRVYNLGEKMVCVEFYPDANIMRVVKYKVYPEQCVISKLGNALHNDQ